MEKDTRENVFEVYNIIADWFAINRFDGLMEKAYLDKTMEFLPTDADVLDLGCGTGKPIMEYLLSSGIKVTGVDASHKMLDIAKSNFPSTEFILADMRKLSLSKKFDAIIAWHSFFHLPAEDQPAMFKIFKDHLNSNGVLLFTSGTEHGEAWGMNGGENLFHASLSTQEYTELLENYGFEVLKHIENDLECGGATVWIVRCLG